MSKYRDMNVGNSLNCIRKKLLDKMSPDSPEFDKALAALRQLDAVAEALGHEEIPSAGVYMHKNDAYSPAS